MSNDKIYSGNYNYANHIPTTKKLKVSGKGDIFTSINDFNAIRVYMDTLIYGKNIISSKGDYKQHPLGQNYFIKSGTCGDESTDECKGKDRYLYIENIPTGKIPCMGKYAPKTNFKGLIPGMLEDVAKVNPMATFNNMRGVGFKVNDKCIKQTLPVGPATNSHKKGKYKETHCSPELRPPDCMPNITEFFKQNSKKYVKLNQIQQNKKNKKNNNYIYLILIIIIIIIIILIILSKY